MKHFLTTLWTDESGQDLAEYVLLLVPAAIILFRDAIVDGFNGATDRLTNALEDAA
jgi:Flp pilus assembly pilin Flp